MASRFTQLQGIRSNYQEKFHTPNFELLAQVLEKQQKDYNLFEEVNSKYANYMEADTEAAKAHIDQKKANMQAITDAYITGGVQKGNIARKQAMMDVKDDWQQGGKSYGFQQNYDAELKYQEEQKARYNAGLITKDTLDAALKYSRNNFSGSFGEDGTFNKFSGYETAEDIDLSSHIDQKLTGYVSETTGREVGKMLNGDYYYMDTMEGIPRQELLDAVDHITKTDPKVRAYLDQQDLIFDQRDTKILNSEGIIQNAKTFLANKYDGIKSKRQVITNWRAQENLRHYRAKQRQKAEEVKVPAGDMGTKRSAVYNLTRGLNKVAGEEGKNYRINQIREEIYKLRGAKQQRSVGSQGGAMGPALPLFTTEEDQQKIIALQNEMKALEGSKQESAKAELDFYQTPEGRSQFPVMARAIEDNPRQTITDPNFYGMTGKLAEQAGFVTTRPETDEEYLKRVTESSNRIIDHLAQVATTVIPLPEEGYDNAYKMYITQGKLLNMNGSHIDPAMGPSPGENIKQLVINAGGEINGKNAEAATDDDWNKWLKTSVGFNGYTVPGPKAGNDAYDLPTGLEVTLSLGANNAPMTILLDDSTDEQKRMAKETQRFATPMYAPHEAKNADYAQLDLYNYDVESGRYIKQDNDENGWSYGSITVPGLGEVVSRVNPGIYEDPSLEPIVYQVIKNDQGIVTGLKQAVAVQKNSEGNTISVSAPRYSEVIKTRAMMDRNSTMYTKVKTPK